MSDENAKLECKKIQQHALPMGALGMDVLRDTDQAFVACMDGVYETSLATGESRKLYEHDSYASGVIVIHESGQIVSAGYDGVLKWYDLYAGRVIRTIKAHSFWSWDLARARDEPVFASVTGQYLAGSYEYFPKKSDEPCVCVYDALTGKVLNAFEHGPPTQAVAMTNDGEHVAAGNLMGEVGVWKIASEPNSSPVANWKTNDFTGFGIIKSHCQIGGIYAARFTNEDQLLIAGMGPMRDPMAGNGKMRWQQFDWSGKEPEKVATTNDGKVGEGLMETLAVSPDGRHFVMGGRLRGGSWNVGIFGAAAPNASDPTKGESKAATRFVGEPIHAFEVKKRITKALFSNDGKRLYLAGAGGQNQDPKKQKDFGVLQIYDVIES